MQDGLPRRIDRGDDNPVDYPALLRTAALAGRSELPAFLQELCRRLLNLVQFNFLNLGIYDTDAHVMRVYMLDVVSVGSLEPIERPVDDSPSGWVWIHQQRLVIPDLNVEKRFSAALDSFRARGSRSLVALPLTTADKQLGALVFGNEKAQQYSSETLRQLEAVAGLVAMGMENSMAKHALTGDEDPLRLLTAVTIKLSQQNLTMNQSLREEKVRLQALLEINSTLVESDLDLQAIFGQISTSLQKAVLHDFAAVTVLNEAKNHFQVEAVAPSGIFSNTFPVGLQVPAKEAVSTAILGKGELQVVGHADLQVYGSSRPDVQRALDAGLKSICVASMRTPRRNLGTLCILSRFDNAFSRRDCELINQVATSLALFIEHSMTGKELRLEKDSLQTSLEISQVLTSKLDIQELFQEISRTVQRAVAHDYAHLTLYDEPSRTIRIHALDSLHGIGLANPAATVLSGSPEETVIRSGKTHQFTAEDLEKFASKLTRDLLAEGMRWMCCFPLISRDRVIGTLSIATRKDTGLSAYEIELLERIVPQMAVAVDNARAYREIAGLKDKLSKEKLYLEAEIRETLNQEEIVGASRALAQVLEKVKTVAPTSATVLITGETGTGKELIARAVHRLSTRRDGNFIKLNCAAIPTGLLESELFGHEKGAFTGAISQKVGRLELADKGTVFLDEIGEIPLELQPKLLRVLQDHEFERLGGNRTIRVNVRVVSATNRDLEKAVASHEFRSDLFYRLNVFPIHLPPLRERVQDIRALADFFVTKFTRKMGKRIELVPEETIAELERWHWPGNIREFENFIERSVILTEGPVLNAPLTELHPTLPGKKAPETTLENVERDYILQTLRAAFGVISGSNGAAARLGMKRTTLQSKMQRLGIQREEYET